MHLHRRQIGPQFDEHDPVRILGIDVAIVRDAGALYSAGIGSVCAGVGGDGGGAAGDADFRGR